MKKLWSKTLKILINELKRSVHMCEKFLKKVICIIVRFVTLKILKYSTERTIRTYKKPAAAAAKVP